MIVVYGYQSWLMTLKVLGSIPEASLLFREVSILKVPNLQFKIV